MRMPAALLVLAGASLVGCPSSGGVPTVHAGDAAAVGTGTLDLLVVDERERPLEGAVVWAPGTHVDAPPGEAPVVIEQEGLEFRPRFVVARRGQRLEVRNSDTEVHNVHGSGGCCDWNILMPVGDARSFLLDKAGEGVLRCDIHAHMRCTVVVLDALSALTDAGGHARLALPLGARKLHVRALDRDRLDLDVTIAAVTTARVVLPLPPGGPEIMAPDKLPWPTIAVRIQETLDEAVRLARLGKGDEARDAADEALGKWFSGSGLYGAIREHDAGTEHQGRCEDFKSELSKMRTRAENAAAQGGEAVDKLARQVERLENMLLNVARELPKR